MTASRILKILSVDTIDRGFSDIINRLKFVSKNKHRKQIVTP